MTTHAVLVIGIGGATSSGKTTLAKNLFGILSHVGTPPIAAVHVLHQDDFTFPMDQMPWNAKWQVTDWDTPRGSINYERMARVLEHLRATGEFPHGFASSEHRRSKYDCRLSAAQRDMWSARFRALHHVHVHGRPVDSVTIVLVEGLLLYYNAQVRRLIDIPLFLRVSRAEVLARRTSRSNYILEDGSTWVDPPFYFDEIVWPAYTEAHAGLFTGGDVERGALTDACAADAERDGAPVANMVLFDGCGPSDRASPRTVAVPQPDRDGVELAQAVCAVLLDAIK